MKNIQIWILDVGIGKREETRNYFCSNVFINSQDATPLSAYRVLEKEPSCISVVDSIRIFGLSLHCTTMSPLPEALKFLSKSIIAKPTGPQLPLLS